VKGTWSGHVKGISTELLGFLILSKFLLMLEAHAGNQQKDIHDYISMTIYIHIHTYIHTYIILVLIIVMIPVPEDQIVIAQVVQGQTLIHSLAPIQLLQHNVCVCVCVRARARVHMQSGVRGSSSLNTKT